MTDPQRDPFAAASERVAQITAHRACCGSEHDPSSGKLHGYCVVCGVPWPCDYAGTPSEALRALREALEEVSCADHIGRATLIADRALARTQPADPAEESAEPDWLEELLERFSSGKENGFLFSEALDLAAEFASNAYKRGLKDARETP